ncbi:MAG: ARMT1-like domain-containing protein [Desulfobulbaceae bacterium]|nr:ARMT1-like domain-containing protein [Desulfobulbaceae bacterium]HIJ78731.1 DUF89 family protein [Deltaproteobacteria bacterium]
MHTSPECLECLRRQARYAASLTGKDLKGQNDILAQVDAYLAGIDLKLSPPENAVPIYRLIAQQSKCSDPFALLKKQSNTFAAALRNDLAAQIKNSPQPLLTAIRYAIAGNVIDYGSQHRFDIKQTIDQCLNQDFAINDFELFKKDLAQAENILYLGDNCGEMIFDSLLIELLKQKITLALKESPIINDATLADGMAYGLNRYCHLISNGSDCPGTSLADCSEDFNDLFAKAELIISKGQGNFETLSESSRPIYFLLTVKCRVVAQQLRVKTGHHIPLGGMVLLRQKKGADR